MARPKALAAHPDRDSIEAALIEGRNIVELSQSSGISLSSLYRSKQALLRDREAADTAENLSRVSIARRLAGIAADLRHARLTAGAKGQVRLQTLAAGEERRVLGDLLSLVPEMDAAETEANAQALGSAVGALVRSRGDYLLTQELAAQLRARGASEELSASVEDLAIRQKEKSQ
ncbi:hypothetical protein SCB71_15495 [Herbiconiux sp. KACC 21604]|uniref:hypothetical protein n=1 Tax=unclassified Herbiconiux TaxID=2618217 RepID=UPI0014921D11|nr:hypothetical protein [Herbiconiux sp. SALV-R1]QJU54531.1 hypothetical protein HL652_13440 [Herbiconiux sp. SALV-R1]WPO85614.1 hypothetical protein SCB71_15495 [Herbiconiux sp. KACC 21604]